MKERKHLFRAFNKEDGEMWHVRTINFDKGLVWLVESDSNEEQAFPMEMNNVELMEYINLNDKNKKKMYEKDICTDGKRIFIIFSCPGGFGICLLTEWIQTGGNPIIYDGLSDAQNASWANHNLEIIGNLYQNQELLQ